MASKRALRRCACTGKKRFDLFETAFLAMRAVLRHDDANKDPGVRMSVYRCRFCRGFHFGHQPRPRLGRGASVLAASVS